MRLGRRAFLKGAAAGAGALAAPAVVGRAADGTVTLAAILDLSGGLGIYGRPMEDALRLAVDELNGAGGVTGRPVGLRLYDAQSRIQLYTQYAARAALRDGADVVQAGITSASREAIRPILGRHRTLYFYNVQYEGGVCDRNVFCTGSTPAQTVQKLVPYALGRWGPRVYVVAADYNYGRITASWVRKFVADHGGETVGTEFFPLDVASFGPAIAKIQAARPDLVVSVLVGGAHVSFYRQYAASGMHREAPVASTTFGAGNEHFLLSPEEGEGIVVAYGYFQENDIPANRAFLDRMRARYGEKTPYVNELAARTYEGVKLWAAAAERAGSTGREEVVEALERGAPLDGPSGPIRIDPATHHIVQNVYLAELRDRAFRILETYPEQPPADTRLVCDLAADPDQARSYFENGLEAAGIR